MARPKARGQARQKEQKHKRWYVAFYIRLSREDARPGTESESVQNQRLILGDWLKNRCDGDEYSLAGEYVDDGVSGTTDDDRPAFQHMLGDIQAGKVNCVVVKNLARSFRNHADQGYYLEDWFVVHSVRFISLYQQSVDTYRDPQGASSLSIPVQGVLNESHARDTSENVRRVLDQKRRSGQHIGAFAAYGYQKDPMNKNALIPDEPAAQVVRDIYAAYLRGMSKSGILRMLNDQGIPCPSIYKRQRGLKYKNPNAQNRPLWTSKTISDILRNQLYTGDMVQGRHRIRSYKIHIQDAVDKDEWFIVPNTHPPLVSKQQFEAVQALLVRDTRTAPGGTQLYLFSGFLRCADCGKAMCRSRVRDRVYYFCRTYKEQSKNACTKHAIRHEKLERAVLLALKTQLFLAPIAQSVLAQISSPPGNSQTDKLQAVLNAQETQLATIHRYKQALYQDLKDGLLTQEDYLRMHADYEQEDKRLRQLILTLTNEQAGMVGRPPAIPPLMETLATHQTITTLTREVLIALVEQIVVFENQRIAIHLTYDRQPDAPLT